MKQEKRETTERTELPNQKSIRVLWCNGTVCYSRSEKHQLQIMQEIKIFFTQTNGYAQIRICPRKWHVWISLEQWGKKRLNQSQAESQTLC